jgi:hypothetical protein
MSSTSATDADCGPSRPPLCTCSAPEPHVQVSQNWYELELEDMRAPWSHYEPFINSHGYTLAASPGFEERAYEGPLLAAQDPFKPGEAECLQYAMSLKQLAPPGWVHFASGLGIANFVLLILYVVSPSLRCRRQT